MTNEDFSNPILITPKVKLENKKSLYVTEFQDKAMNIVKMWILWHFDDSKIIWNHSMKGK